jgi:N-acetylneuraminic acid mutarotase
MKFRTLLLISLAFTAVFNSCDTADEIVGNWVKRAYYGSYARTQGTSFSFDGIGYYGLGMDGDDYFKDFWKFDPSSNSWTQVASLPESATARAFNFYANTSTKGYIGTGYDGDYDLSDFWEYDPSTNKWTQLDDFPGGTRRDAVAFVIGDDLYAGTGSSDDEKKDYNDFYKYSNGAWVLDSAGNTTITSFSGQKRKMTTVVVMDGKAYMISGRTHSDVNIKDFWCYDPESNSWSEFDKLTDEDTGDAAIPRYDAVGFTVNSKIYFGTGYKSTGSNSSDFWEWDPISKYWLQKTSLEGDSRHGASCFVLNGEAYVLCGNGSLYEDDVYRFEPDAEKDSDD